MFYSRFIVRDLNIIFGWYNVNILIFMLIKNVYKIRILLYFERYLVILYFLIYFYLDMWLFIKLVIYLNIIYIVKKIGNGGDVWDIGKFVFFIS